MSYQKDYIMKKPNEKMSPSKIPSAKKGRRITMAR
jgi:hypothetical protein